MTGKEKIKAGTKKAIEGAKRTRFFGRTPKFWQKMQLAGAILAGVGTIIISAPVSVPAGLATWGTYMITVGTTVTGIGQFAKQDDK